MVKKRHGTQVENRMSLTNTFTLLTFTRPWAYDEEGYSNFKRNIHTKCFLVCVNKFLILTIIMPGYNYGIFNVFVMYIFRRICQV